MNHSETILEFNQIKEQLCEYAMSQPAQTRLRALTPILSERECRARIEETTAARLLLDAAGTPPLPTMKGIAEMLTLAQKGSMLSPEQLSEMSVFLASCGRMKRYLQKAVSVGSAIGGYGETVEELSGLREAIEAAVQSGVVQESASSQLRALRRKLELLDEQVKQKLGELLRSRKSIFSDHFVSMRGGRFVLPVKKEYKNQISGTVVDTSGSGGTCFIEPSSVSKLQQEIGNLQNEEENEIRRILYALTVQVDTASSALLCNMQAMETLDLLFAKARLSAAMDAVPAELIADREITIVCARHPLLRREQCVPLDFTIGQSVRGVIITGPNTGGKTVALKTVGLLAMMAQSGLHVPAKQMRFCMHNLILCDIGDGQSISENLSTFSAHIKNIVEILQAATAESLVLLDELGSGTDPAEGMGIAISILEELRQKQCLFLATTHYPEVKDYAASTPELVNARMAFDRESLLPLYRLELGEAGESCALYIARRLGFPAHMLQRAYCAAYPTAPQASAPVSTAPPTLPDDSAPAQALPRIASPALLRECPTKAAPVSAGRFSLGDSVLIGPDNQIGLVWQPVDTKGMVGVQIKGTKQLINEKRLTLKTPASELYPPDYDFSILFDSVATRKARHLMGKRHVKGLEIPLGE